MKLVKSCDLMIVMGTALMVSPFNMLVEMAPKSAH
jgi:NAD-dependent SIR2 family protein deacetylase